MNGEHGEIFFGAHNSKTETDHQIILSKNNKRLKRNDNFPQIFGWIDKKLRKITVPGESFAKCSAIDSKTPTPETVESK